MKNLLFLVFILLSNIALGEGTFIKQGALVEGLTSTATSGGNLTLTVTSQTIQQFTGSTTHTVNLPDATQMPVSRRFLMINASTGIVTVKNFTGTTVTTVPANSSVSVHLTDISTTAGVWRLSGNTSFSEVDPLSIHKNGDNSPTADISWGNHNLTNVNNISATTVTLSGEPASRALYLDGSNVVRGSPTTSAELANVAGLTSPVQTQLNSKANLTLSNLTAPTAINQNLLFASGFNVGSSSAGKPNLWVNNQASVGNVVNFGGTLHIAAKPSFTMKDTDNSTNSITAINGTTSVHLTSASPNALAELSVGDVVALSSAPSTFATVTAVTDNSNFVVSTNLGNGQIAQTVIVYPAILNLEDSSNVNALYLNRLGLTVGQNVIQRGGTSGAITFKTPNSVTSYPLTWPSVQGANGTTLTNDGSGNLSWQAGGGGGGANTTLSNLVSPTAVNQDLLIPANKLQIGPIPGDANLQASISTDTGYDGPTVLLIQGLGANSNNYSGIYLGNDDNEVALNIFVNGSARSSDGGVENATIRMENGGTLRVKAVGGLTLEGSVSFPDSINDDANNLSLNTNTRQMLDDGGNNSLNWQNRVATDDNSDTAINWNNKTLQVGGSTKYNWDNGIFRDAGTNKTADVESRELYDVNGDLVASWNGPAFFQADNIQQNGATSGHINFTVPTTVTTYGLVWPNAQGGSNTFLRNDGSGNLTWASAGGGGSVSGPGSSTNNGIATWNGTGGTTLFSTPATVDSSGNIATTGTITAGVMKQESPQASAVTTTNATPTTFATIALANNTVFHYRAECTARRTDSADRGVFVRSVAAFREAAGSATLQGPVQSDFSQSSDNTWDVGFAVSSTNLLLQVTGATSKTINWQCNLRSTRVQ